MDLWQEVQQLFDCALQYPPDKRGEYLEQACGPNHELRREVESLLAAHEESDTFMAEPALAGLAEVLQSTTNSLNHGDMLGSYKVLELIGRGGMGEVYRARDTRLKRDVAIKAMPRAFAADGERLRRFEQEARAAAALNHPNILSVYDMGVRAGLPYMVSELLEGQNLRELLRQGPIPASNALHYAIQAARGLAAAHDAGIIHRDLKPDNLFICKDGRLKILDFGLAKLTRSNQLDPENEAAPETEAGRVFGTVGYMSPEQVRGQVADHRSDIFSFGAILYELFSGKRALGGDSPADRISAILHQDPSDLTSVVPPVHPAVDRTIRHALEKNPLERFQSVHDLAFQLEGAAADPFSQRKNRVIQPLSAKFSARVLRLIALSAALILPCVLVSSLYSYFHSRQDRQLTDKDTIVLADFSNKTGDGVFDDALKQGLSISLSQSPFLNVLPDGKVGATLKMMGRTAKDRLTQEVAREVCVRTNSKAMLAGSISSLGSQYVIGLKAVNCNTGDALAQEQVQAASKEEVLKALDKATIRLRAQLGEALATVQKYDSPLEQATTPSLDALQAYSEGIKMSSGDDTAALPMFKRSIALDPNFAVAYAALGISYSNLGENGMANESFQKAYELRERVSEQEKYKISAGYFRNVTGELEKSHPGL